MKTENKRGENALKSFFSKVMQDKKDIKEAFINKKPMSELAKEKGIKFAQPL